MKHCLLLSLFIFWGTITLAQDVEEDTETEEIEEEETEEAAEDTDDESEDEVTEEDDPPVEDGVIAKGPWRFRGSLGINFNRVNLENWAGGGRNTVAAGSILKTSANIVKRQWAWRNNLDIAYGIARVGGKENTFKKSDDQIILVSKYSRRINNAFSLTGLMDFRTQIAYGYNYTEDVNDEGEAIENARLISKFMNPGFLITSIGLEHREETYFFIGAPVSGKFTFVTDDEFSDRGDFGVTPGSHIRPEVGTMVKAGFDDDIWKNVSLSSNVMLFSSYETYGNIDINWEMQLSFKINEYLQANLTTYLIYDEDIDIERDDGSVGAATQFKDVLNIGFLYTL